MCRVGLKSQLHKVLPSSYNTSMNLGMSEQEKRSLLLEIHFLGYWCLWVEFGCTMETHWTAFKSQVPNPFWNISSNNKADRCYSVESRAVSSETWGQVLLSGCMSNKLLQEGYLLLLANWIWKQHWSRSAQKTYSKWFYSQL